MGASGIFAFNLGVNSLAYVLFAVSSSCSIYLLKKSQAQSILIWTQVYFLCVNIIGFFKYWK